MTTAIQSVIDDLRSKLAEATAADARDAASYRALRALGEGGRLLDRERLVDRVESLFGRSTPGTPRTYGEDSATLAIETALALYVGATSPDVVEAAAKARVEAHHGTGGWNHYGQETRATLCEDAKIVIAAALRHVLGASFEVPDPAGAHYTALRRDLDTARARLADMVPRVAIDREAWAHRADALALPEDAADLAAEAVASAVDAFAKAVVSHAPYGGAHVAAETVKRARASLPVVAPKADTDALRRDLETARAEAARLSKAHEQLVADLNTAKQEAGAQLAAALEHIEVLERAERDALDLAERRGREIEALRAAPGGEWSALDLENDMPGRMSATERYRWIARWIIATVPRAAEAPGAVAPAPPPDLATDLPPLDAAAQALDPDVFDVASQSHSSNIDVLRCALLATIDRINELSRRVVALGRKGAL